MILLRHPLTPPAVTPLHERIYLIGHFCNTVLEHVVCAVASAVGVYRVPVAGRGHGVQGHFGRVHALHGPVQPPVIFWSATIGSIQTVMQDQTGCVPRALQRQGVGGIAHVGAGHDQSLYQAVTLGIATHTAHRSNHSVAVSTQYHTQSHVPAPVQYTEYASGRVAIKRFRH